MIEERGRIVREAARAADRLQHALETGASGRGSARDSERTGGGRKAPVHGSAPLDVTILDCLVQSYEVVLDEIDTMRQALADPAAATVNVPVQTLQAGFAFLAEHLDEVPEEVGDTVAMTCRREHGRYARTLAGAYGERSRRCPTCDQASLLPETAVAPDGRGHVLVCSTPECDPAPGRWRRFDLVRDSGIIPGVDGGALVSLKELAAMTGIPYRTLDSAVRRAKIAPVPTSSSSNSSSSSASAAASAAASTNAGAATRLFRLADVQALPALRRATRVRLGGLRD
ncbi:hypothetical protein [Catenulispora sp. EB89]|uniref:hypothetical protein n=1 Tax=Catenulispora sp. EB89 TaxID=3156257 RepID=UPI00351196C2